MSTERELTGINSGQFQESYVQMSLNVSGKAHLHPENTTLRAYEYLMEGVSCQGDPSGRLESGVEGELSICYYTYASFSFRNWRKPSYLCQFKIFFWKPDEKHPFFHTNGTADDKLTVRDILCSRSAPIKSKNSLYYLQS